ncbi:MAG: nucleotidyltransferase substrate binding protein [Aquificaceae bacterium]|jgi:nucleotidyltransferase substrate binding protein (TIGR01987 family)|uniref:nucleotidyltransferase substrate binding protein n=1 Tax=Hydrogenobacter sp. Uz 6-8 TaxID=3384828 RepID=UPI0030A59F47
MSQRLEQFRKALQRLEEVLSLQEENEIFRDSAIQRFEFTFDLAWKSLKDYILEAHGLECNSPKSCFRLAFSLGLIDHDEYWLKICDFRNLTSHTYNEELAEKIYRELPEVLKYFKKLYRIIS